MTWNAAWYADNADRLRAADKDAAIRKNAKTIAIKLERGCADCGYNTHAAALHFDHLPGFDKLFGIGNSGNRTWESILQEIDKCDVVCANCHAIRTYTRAHALRNEVEDVGTKA
jgi:hypothetical protein